jgi:hypothetical protein
MFSIDNIYINIPRKRITLVKVPSSSFLGKGFFLVKKIIRLMIKTRNNGTVKISIKNPKILIRIISPPMT